MRNLLWRSVLALLLSTSAANALAVAWYPLPSEAYKFGQKYPEAQSLLYAFDYGHALVYERLLALKGTTYDAKAVEKKLLIDILAILKDPPKVKMEEADIAPNYVYTFPLILDLFDWSHLLHQFVLDVLATAPDRGDPMKARINELFLRYKGEKAIAITDVCKTMLFMDGHAFSKEFRRRFPSFNLLIWSYHWFQIRLYEDLMLPTEAERDAGVAKTVKDFFALVSDLPDSADFDMMPETAKEAPTFAATFPSIPPAFDNNHMLHDVVSDMIVSDKVKSADFFTEEIRLGRMSQDPDAFRARVCP